jgi:hypothetical protein
MKDRRMGKPFSVQTTRCGNFRMIATLVDANFRRDRPGPLFSNSNDLSRNTRATLCLR